MPRYEWDIDILYDARPKDASEVVMRLADMGCSEYNLCQAEDLLLSGKPNQGLTFSDRQEHHTLIVVGRASNVGQFINTFVHELDHCVDHISQYYGIGYASEENSYLMGDLVGMICEDAYRKAKILFYDIID